MEQVEMVLSAVSDFPSALKCYFLRRCNLHQRGYVFAHLCLIRWLVALSAGIHKN